MSDNELIITNDKLDGLDTVLKNQKHEYIKFPNLKIKSKHLLTLRKYQNLFKSITFEDCSFEEWEKELEFTNKDNVKFENCTFEKTINFILNDIKNFKIEDCIANGLINFKSESGTIGIFEIVLNINNESDDNEFIFENLNIKSAKININKTDNHRHKLKIKNGIFENLYLMTNFNKNIIETKLEGTIDEFIIRISDINDVKITVSNYKINTFKIESKNVDITINDCKINHLICNQDDAKIYINDSSLNNLEIQQNEISELNIEGSNIYRLNFEVKKILSNLTITKTNIDFIHFEIAETSKANIKFDKVLIINGNSSTLQIKDIFSNNIEFVSTYLGRIRGIMIDKDYLKNIEINNEIKDKLDLIRDLRENRDFYLDYEISMNLFLLEKQIMYLKLNEKNKKIFTKLENWIEKRLYDFYYNISNFGINIFLPFLYSLLTIIWFSPIYYILINDHLFSNFLYRMAVPLLLIIIFIPFFDPSNFKKKDNKLTTFRIMKYIINFAYTLISLWIIITYPNTILLSIEIFFQYNIYNIKNDVLILVSIIERLFSVILLASIVFGIKNKLERKIRH